MLFLNEVPVPLPVHTPSHLWLKCMLKYATGSLTYFWMQIEVVAGLHNGGDETYNVTAIYGSLNAANDFRYYFQNFTGLVSCKFLDNKQYLYWRNKPQYCSAIYNVMQILLLPWKKKFLIPIGEGLEAELSQSSVDFDLPQQPQISFLTLPVNEFLLCSVA